MSIQVVFKALSDPTRRAILSLLKDGALTAGEIGAHFDTAGATVSHHLSVLRQADLIQDDRRGKFIYYDLNLSVLDEITGWFAQLKGVDSSHEKQETHGSDVDFGASTSDDGLTLSPLSPG